MTTPDRALEAFRAMDEHLKLCKPPHPEPQRVLDAIDEALEDATTADLDAIIECKEVRICLTDLCREFAHGQEHGAIIAAMAIAGWRAVNPPG
ncbi:hypothetical protein [Cellulomonas soli]|uniref:Uncharacterized protein n=1 Tax=Cellulomonas soli TaxID=931535 RepID=A0A512PDT2_9CELL|nr:hypothetical protein [Cellulomonas soli]NYI59139.1 hypothetical protein [Cellulomonas soli]GEP69369.1 hypothetical protein CSO01_20840 [Cellulomonas soli]